MNCGTYQIRSDSHVIVTTYATVTILLSRDSPVADHLSVTDTYDIAPLAGPYRCASVRSTVTYGPPYWSTALRDANSERCLFFAPAGYVVATVIWYYRIHPY